MRWTQLYSGSHWEAEGIRGNNLEELKEGAVYRGQAGGEGPSKGHGSLQGQALAESISTPGLKGELSPGPWEGSSPAGAAGQGAGPQKLWLQAEDCGLVGRVQRQRSPPLPSCPRWAKPARERSRSQVLAWRTSVSPSSRAERRVLGLEGRAVEGGQGLSDGSRSGHTRHKLW